MRRPRSCGPKVLKAISSRSRLTKSHRRRPLIGPETSSGSGNCSVRARQCMAAFLGVNVNTLRSWEQGKRSPQSIASRFLSEIETDITYWRRRIDRNS